MPPRGRTVALKRSFVGSSIASQRSNKPKGRFVSGRSLLRANGHSEAAPVRRHRSTGLHSSAGGCLSAVEHRPRYRRSLAVC